MAQALARRGWRVALLADPRGALARRAEQGGLTCHRMRLRSLSLGNPFKMARLLGLLRRLRPQAAILNASHELKVVGLAARVAGVPRILFRRGIPQPLRRGRLNRWYLSRVVNRLIVNSRATLDAMASGFSDLMPRLNPVVIHNGIDAEEWQPAPGPPGAGWIGVVGRLTKEKGVDRGIRTLAAARRRRPEAKLLVVGDGPERPSLERLAQALGLGEAVRFVGQTDRVAEHLRRCDVFFLPSRWEGFGYVLLEAMLLELPCVAFDIPSAREIISGGKTGLIVPDGDLEAAGEALADLLADPARARVLGRAGRARALAEFPLDRAVERLERVLAGE
jgi:glycosyltransferase involved in cell wall biosynthesis